MNYRKLIVLDLDDTLWSGTLGDDGWEGLRPHVAFQTGLKRLKDCGVLLAIASMNEERAALAALDSIPGMVLRSVDFVAHRINRQDKAGNIESVCIELNLGLESVVFIDDNPFQRGRVRETLPDVLVPDWPNDPDLYLEALEALDCFDMGAPTEEDRMRTQMYLQERERARARSGSDSLADWLRTLGTSIDFRYHVQQDFERSLQLLNKTNQMNLRTERYDDRSWREVLNDPRNEVLTVRVSDRFGDAGLTGVIRTFAPFAFCPEVIEVRDFVLSCRVMGRLVEEAMVKRIVDSARARRCKRIIASLKPTQRNAPVREFWEQRSGFSRLAGTDDFELVLP